MLAHDRVWILEKLMIVRASWEHLRAREAVEREEREQGFTEYPCKSSWESFQVGKANPERFSNPLSILSPSLHNSLSLHCTCVSLAGEITPLITSYLPLLTFAFEATAQTKFFDEFVRAFIPVLEASYQQTSRLNFFPRLAWALW